MKRRDALQKLMIGTGTIFILPAAFVSCETEPVQEDPGNGGNGGNNGGNPLEINLDDSKYTILNSTGGFVIVSNIIVANLGSGNFVALSSLCTHQNCDITFDAGSNNFPCPCHGSLFSSQGAVIEGPAKTPLKKYTVTRTDNILSIT